MIVQVFAILLTQCLRSGGGSLVSYVCRVHTYIHTYMIPEFLVSTYSPALLEYVISRSERRSTFLKAGNRALSAPVVDYFLENIAIVRIFLNSEATGVSVSILKSPRSGYCTTPPLHLSTNKDYFPNQSINILIRSRVCSFFCPALI